MNKSLATALLAGAMLLTAGATKSVAGTITFNDSATNPEGVFTGENTVSVWDDSGTGIMPLLDLDLTGLCGQTASGCSDSTTGYDTADFGSPSDYQYNGGGFISVTGGAPAPSVPTGTTVGTDSFDSVADVTEDICQSSPALCAGGQSGALTTNTLNTPLGDIPSNLGGDQNVFVGAADGDPIAIAAVPESGTLILVGMGLVGAAKYLRRRKVA